MTAPQRVGTLVKVCGLTSLGEALSCARAGVDWIGLNFHPGSPRRVDPSLAAEIVAALPEGCAPVGLFVDRGPDEVAATAERVGLRVVQLHGSEPPEDLLALASLVVVKAFRLSDRLTVAALRAYLDRAETLGRTPFAVLVDAFVPGLAGGTGQLVDPAGVDRLPTLPRLILAGGLTPENVAGRIARVQPWMVDAASGVESSPGRKDPARVAAFVQAVRDSARDCLARS
jgi:phosphoribosylanthranilate isomerase